MDEAIVISKRTARRVLVVAVIIAAFGLGVFLFKTGNHQSAQHEKTASQAAEMPKASPSSQESPASGHAHGAPQKKPTAKGTGPIRYTMSQEAKTLAEVQTTEVKREKAIKRLRTVGMVFDAETRVATLTARIDGCLDEVFIDFTGVKVNKGDPMVTIWSPTLIKSEVELFESIRSGDAESVIRGAEEKLVQYGMTKEQVERIRKNMKAELYVTLRAPISGIVMKKMAVLGQFVKEGQDMFEINDLSHVWVKLDAYEPDLPWIRYGQDVTFTTPSVPGKTFKGRVIFIDPFLEMATRTVKVRVDAANPDYELKPHMFVNAEIESEIDHQGNVIKPEWVGKYICPFDPSEVSDVPGICPKTKQPLQPATAYGYSGVENPVLPLVIPESAVLFTGKRSLVYVEVPGQPQPKYEQRDVTLGPRVGNKYVVVSGLKEGEQVVVKGNFQIDSSVQILGEPSMMNPAEPEKAAPSAPEVISGGPEPQTNHGGHDRESKDPVGKSPEADPHSAHGKEGQ